jgi:hypothetical protein
MNICLKGTKDYNSVQDHLKVATVKFVLGADMAIVGVRYFVYEGAEAEVERATARATAPAVRRLVSSLGARKRAVSAQSRLIGRRATMAALPSVPGRAVPDLRTAGRDVRRRRAVMAPRQEAPRRPRPTTTKPRQSTW